MGLFEHGGTELPSSLVADASNGPSPAGGAGPSGMGFNLWLVIYGKTQATQSPPREIAILERIFQVSEGLLV